MRLAIDAKDVKVNLTSGNVIMETQARKIEWSHEFWNNQLRIPLRLNLSFLIIFDFSYFFTSEFQWKVSLYSEYANVADQF